MRPRCRCQKDTLTLLHYRGNPVFRKNYREGERGRGRLEREKIDPARLILMRRFDLMIRMGFRVMVFRGVRMHQSDRAAVIVAMMGMKQRCGNQGDNHGHHGQTCAKPMHAQIFLHLTVEVNRASFFSAGRPNGDAVDDYHKNHLDPALSVGACPPLPRTESNIRRNHWRATHRRFPLPLVPRSGSNP